MFDWLEWLRLTHMHSERKEKGRFVRGGDLVPGQLFALARMLPIIFRGRTVPILGASAVAISSPEVYQGCTMHLYINLLDMI